MKSQNPIVCAAQIAPVYMNLEATADKIIEKIAEAGKLGAELVVFPETVLPGYPYWTLIHDPYSARIRFSGKLYEQALRLDSPIVKRLQTAAREAGCVSVIGINELDGGTIYNSQLSIDADGSILGCRRKLVPTHHERITWGKGDGSDLQTWNTSVGKVGALICYEHTNPLFRYAIQAQGEDIHIANWPGGMPWTDDLIDAAVRMYAIESASFVISTTSIFTEDIADYLGTEASQKLKIGGGASSIVAPGGKYLARAQADNEELLTAQLDFKLIAEWKHIVDGCGHYSRPDVLKLQVNLSKQLNIETTYQSSFNSGV
ncbi:carbon-nitrogen hydrolase family protein [Glaciimonas sp. Gout2]|uniref:carbon-nitrogen hydrolase family protein n=2 Tax=Glaciimonas TaxID=1229970 RepID=UPI002AB595F0|nr:MULTISPECIES: carbon-nitrogen hydrolase family protein [unclassified Glaciimonas]MDY7548931.1 carbon-nitrogen hydrolase family protein [Glaciimonas sp. CA11.2]MEB0013629.1 carbon-nitrogen hydrolase family protein [Glaciimonas sp. Cout2]MEB0083655.1 carbon-nitrogen hydrolase family protein [Glaciimonas sp. Gout2]